MKKTLFIKIDNTPIPVEAENEVVPLDCKQINDFCSFAGDALVGDLKDNNGTPFYRLINPVGRLLSDFEKVDKTSYDKIIAQWLDVLGEMLHKGVTQCEEQFTIHFPQQYVDWLLCNENNYYVEIGKCLQSNEGKVFLDANGISEDVISALHMKIRRFLNDNKDDIEYIVFSNERIGNSSSVVKQLKTVFESYSFLRLNQLRDILNDERKEKIESLSDLQSLSDFLHSVKSKGLVQGTWISVYWLDFSEKGCYRLDCNRESYNKDINHLLNIVCKCKNVEFKNMNISELSSFLLAHEFKGKNPYLEYNYTKTMSFWKSEFHRVTEKCRCDIMLKTEWGASLYTCDLRYTIEIVLK